ESRRVRRAPRPPRPKSHLGAITLSALLVLAGVVWLLDLADVITLDVGVMVALALALVGAALITSAWFGRARGLIALGIALALAVGAFGVIDVPLRGGIGDTTHRPRAVGAVDGSYEMAIGRLTVDLGAVDFSGRRRTVHAALGIGKLDVIVPDGVRVVADGHAGAGTVIVFGRRTRDCCPVDVRRVRPGDVGGGTLRLTAEVGAGDVEISTEERNGTS
ncbi:MAG TPA: LiaF domain-containing protein, partial [Acidimicrobiia bacterium]|nr:LiaF domain-containing protein [Acidimicrobiia bacterium]